MHSKELLDKHANANESQLRPAKSHHVRKLDQLSSHEFDQELKEALGIVNHLEDSQNEAASTRVATVSDEDTEAAEDTEDHTNTIRFEIISAKPSSTTEKFCEEDNQGASRAERQHWAPQVLDFCREHDWRVRIMKCHLIVRKMAGISPTRRTVIIPRLKRVHPSDSNSSPTNNNTLSSSRSPPRRTDTQNASNSHCRSLSEASTIIMAAGIEETTAINKAIIKSMKKARDAGKTPSKEQVDHSEAFKVTSRDQPDLLDTSMLPSKEQVNLFDTLFQDIRANFYSGGNASSILSTLRDLNLSTTRIPHEGRDISIEVDQAKNVSLATDSTIGREIGPLSPVKYGRATIQRLDNSQLTFLFRPNRSKEESSGDQT